MLEHLLRDRVDKKINLLGDILYEECKARFGTLAKKQHDAPLRKGKREAEIDALVQNRRQLHRRWRKASKEKRQSLKVLWNEMRDKLACMQRAELIRKRRKRKEKERASFMRNPFKHAYQLLEEKRRAPTSLLLQLEAAKEEIEQHIRAQYSNSKRNVPLGSQGYVPPPPPRPTTQFDSFPPWLR